MRPIEKILHRLETLERKVKRIQADLEAIKEDNARLRKEKKSLEESILVMKVSAEPEQTARWFWQ